MGRKKTYGIFNKGAQKSEKSSKNKVETVLPDTLYLRAGIILMVFENMMVK